MGTWDCKDLLYVFDAVDLLSGAVRSNTPESPKDARKKTGKSKTRRRQELFVQHLFSDRYGRSGRTPWERRMKRVGLGFLDAFDYQALGNAR